jgi:hypothetical protein
MLQYEKIKGFLHMALDGLTLAQRMRQNSPKFKQLAEKVKDVLAGN